MCDQRAEFQRQPSVLWWNTCFVLSVVDPFQSYLSCHRANMIPECNTWLTREREIMTGSILFGIAETVKIFCPFLRNGIIIFRLKLKLNEM